MATYTNNPNISAAVSATRTTTGTLYTCPPNSYAILNITFQANGDSISVDGKIVCLADFVTGVRGLVIYVGPGQAVTTTHTTSGYVNATGVQFTNGA